MVWAEPVGQDITIPGDKDRSNPLDMRDYILITGDVPAEIPTSAKAALVFYNGKFDANASTIQIKYIVFGTLGGYGSGANAGLSAMQQIMSAWLANVPGATGLTGMALVNHNLNVQATGKVRYNGIHGVVSDWNGLNTMYDIVNRMQAPLYDWINGEQIKGPFLQYQGQLILGQLQNGWTQDSAREPVGIFKDVTGRAWLQGTVLSPAGVAPSNGAIIKIASTGPWAPSQKTERFFAAPIERVVDGAIDVGMAIVRSKTGTDDIFFIVPGSPGSQIRVSLPAINWQCHATT